MSEAPFRTRIAGVAEMGPVVLRGQTYSGPYLSMQLAINPETPTDESARSPQLISEFGRLAAAALRDKEMAEARYRVWREQAIHEITLAPDALEAAINMGAVAADAKKPPSKTAAEGFVRTQPEYMEHQEAIALAAEVWGTMHACYEAAQARNRSIWTFERSGGTASRESHSTETQQAPTPENVYDHEEEPRLPDAEQAAIHAPRTPLPPRSAGPMPPPPPSRENTQPKRRIAPPPPPKR